MRIGIDIASLAFKQQVTQIVLIAGDSDFVPAAIFSIKNIVSGFRLVSRIGIKIGYGSTKHQPSGIGVNEFVVDVKSSIEKSDHVNPVVDCEAGVIIVRTA